MPDNSSTSSSLRHYSVQHRPPRMRLAALVLLFLESSFCLLLKRIRVPGLVRSGRWKHFQILIFCIKMRSSPGRDASLHCDFDTQGEELYSVKWYKVTGIKKYNCQCFHPRVVKRCFGGCLPNQANPSQSIQGRASVLTRCDQPAFQGSASFWETDTTLWTTLEMSKCLSNAS